MNYVLDKNLKPIKATSEEFSTFYRSYDRVVCTTRFPNEIKVSTVFIGDGITFFETTVFCKGHHEDTYPQVSRTWKMAHIIHTENVRTVTTFLEEKSNELHS